VPLLPSSQLEYLEAPNPFIMGIHSEFVNQINKVKIHFIRISTV